MTNQNQRYVQALSAIEGLGWAACQTIKAGDVVWTQDGKGRLTKADLLYMDEKDLTYVYRWRDGHYRDEFWDLVNHSCEPSLAYGPGDCLVALRDIRPGDELTIDYALLGDVMDGYFMPAFSCRCKAPTCRIRVTSLDWSDPRVLARHGKGWRYPSWLQEMVTAVQRPVVCLPEGGIDKGFALLNRFHPDAAELVAAAKQDAGVVFDRDADLLQVAGSADIELSRAILLRRTPGGWVSDVMSMTTDSPREQIESPLFAIESSLEGIEIRMLVDEFSSYCPATGHPDYAKLEIRYRPRRYIVEQKSLRDWLNCFRSCDSYQEEITAFIRDELARILRLKPSEVHVSATWKGRGGITCEVRGLE